jgi:hypothetical protein
VGSESKMIESVIRRLNKKIFLNLTRVGEVLIKK